MQPNEPTSKAPGSDASSGRSTVAWLTQYGIIIAFIILCVAPFPISTFLPRKIFQYPVADVDQVTLRGHPCDSDRRNHLPWESHWRFPDRRGNLWTDNPHSPLVFLIVGMATGLLGLINGCIIAHLKIPPFVARSAC
jgi:hypothetical protein